MANGDRRKIVAAGSVVPADANPTDVPNCTFTCAADELVECWGRYVVQATQPLQDWTDASGRFEFQAKREGSGTPTLSAFAAYEGKGNALTAEFTLTSDANGVVKIQFTKQSYRGSIWLEGFGVVQAET